MSNRKQLLGPLLKGVSRSFYLTLNILPADMREPVGLAYLLARAADTIADTSLIEPARRLDLLLALRAQVNGTASGPLPDAIVSEVASGQQDSEEKRLLLSLSDVLLLLREFGQTDQAAIRSIVSTLTEGMEFDLRTFPDERSGRIFALQALSDLDRYTYMVAGCVGEFWTRMTYAHATSKLGAEEATMIERGIRLGKALQITNVLRDCAKDLRIGRCYLPEAMLAEVGLTPEALLDPETARRAQPMLHTLILFALDHFRAGLNYTLALPRTHPRLRLACIWPIAIGLETVKLLAVNEDWLSPADPVKIRRKQVYSILAQSLPRVASNRLTRVWIERLLGEVESQIRA